MAKYCIKDTVTLDTIAKDLTKEEAEELFNFYEDFCGTDSVFIAKMPISIAQDFKSEYIALFAELQEMGNLI